eukprot:m.115082 g.115082  ORF g.115082 m.115082 type:complete len:650 (-) comp28397_c0_seq3:108-2057(-)
MDRELAEDFHSLVTPVAKVQAELNGDDAFAETNVDNVDETPHMTRTSSYLEVFGDNSPQKNGQNMDLDSSIPEHESLKGYDSDDLSYAAQSSDFNSNAISKNFSRDSVYQEVRSKERERFSASPGDKLSPSISGTLDAGDPSCDFYTSEKDKMLEENGPGAHGQARRLVNSRAIHSVKYPTYNIKRLNERVVFSRKAEFKGWWHILIGAKFGYAVAVIFLAYILVFLAFTPLYMLINKRCGLHLDGSEFSLEEGESWHTGKLFLSALYLSTETMTTIGYGVPDPYYDGCPEGIFIIMIQALIGFMMNAVLFGTVFARISRAQRRALSLAFAPKACIREIRGRFFLCAQICEARREQIINGSAHMYVALQDKHTDTPYVVHCVRTLRPDDSLNQELILCLPNTIVHEIDAWSPLAPPHTSSNRDGFEDQSMGVYEWPCSRLRLDDTLNGNRAAFVCIVCGQTFNSISTIRRHTSYEGCRELKEIVTEEDPHPQALCLFCDKPIDYMKLADHMRENHYRRRITEKTFSKTWTKAMHYQHANCYTSEGHRQDGFRHVGPHMFTRGEIQRWMSQSKPEVILQISATDVATGSCFNAQHSWADDEIVWDRKFSPCVSSDAETGRGVVDFQKFIETEEANPVPEGHSAGFVQFHL